MLTGICASADCGSKRLPDFPLAFKAPGIKLATLPELFVRSLSDLMIPCTGLCGAQDFVDCTGSSNLFNIETWVVTIHLDSLGTDCLSQPEK